MASFEHLPLQGNEIRLLQLASAQAWHYRLVHVDLNSNPRYAALSYTWGDTLAPEPILIDGGPFWVTKNLREALRRLQSHAQASCLWVDAICINQSDNEEKSHQIRMMRMIYERAHAVLVWLGEPQNEEDAHLAFRKIEYFDQIRTSHMSEKVQPRPWWWPQKPGSQQELFSSMLARISPHDKEIFDRPGSPTHRAWQGICSILTSSWWTRTWVCQEATVQEARHFIVRNRKVTPPLSKIEFMYGSFATTWPKLINTADIGALLEDCRGVDMSFMGDSQANFRRMMSIRALRCESREQDFLELMRIFRNSSCHDPRDRVFAPLCIASASAQSSITPTYDKSVTEVYLDVARYYLAQNKLDFLGFVASSRPSPSNPVLKEWPSWLPDWQQRCGFRQFGRVLYVPEEPERAIRHIHYSGMLDFKGTTTNVYHATKDSTVAARLLGLKLEVQGFFCDVVTEIVPFKVVNGRDATQQALALWDPSKDGIYLTGESFQQALERIQAADVEYDFYERICRRGVSIDFDLLKKGPSQVTPEYIEAYKKFSKALLYAISGRSICRTSYGYLGLVHETTEIGDHVYALLGCQVLHTLRTKNGSRREFDYIGECYLHGLMDGEAMDWLEGGGTRVETVFLV